MLLVSPATEYSRLIPQNQRSWRGGEPCAGSHQSNRERGCATHPLRSHTMCSTATGIWTKHLKGKTDLHQTVIDRCIKTLTQKQLIKAVKSVKVFVDFPSLRGPCANPTDLPSTQPAKSTCLPTSTLPWNSLEGLGTQITSLTPNSSNSCAMPAFG